MEGATFKKQNPTETIVEHKTPNVTETYRSLSKNEIS